MTRQQRPIAEGPAGPILLCDLVKGAQLPVLVALVRAGGLPLSNKELAVETGVRDHERLADALFQLSRRNLVANLGHPANRNEWVATAVARQFFLPSGQAELTDPTPPSLEGPAIGLPAPESAEKPHSVGDGGETALSGNGYLAANAQTETAEKPHSRETGNPILRSGAGEYGNSALSSPESESVKLTVESINQVLVSHIHHITQTAAEAWPKQLEGMYHEALLRGKVYRQLVPPLARAMAAEGEDYLPHLLAHIAYSRSSQFAADAQQRPGAYVKLAVQERALGDPAFMPPAGLSFDHALAWALRGGQFESDASADPEPESAPDPVDPIKTDAGAQSLLAVWQAALSRLQLAVNKEVFEQWLRPAALLDYEPDPETLVIGVPHAYARDFLEHRLMDRIQSSLGAVIGRSVAVRVVVQSAVGAAPKARAA